MTSFFKTPIRILLSLGFLLGISACGNSTPESIDPGVDVGSPPSMTADGTNKVVALSADLRSRLEIEWVTTESSPAQISEWVNGLVYPAPGTVAHVSSTIGGWVTRIVAHEGEFVRKGQVVLTLSSADLAGLTADMIQATAELEFSKTETARYQRLVTEGLGAQKDLDRATANLKKTEAAEQALKIRLASTGLTTQELEALLADPSKPPVLNIRAPISGFINQHLVEIGQAVKTYDLLLDIIATNKVFVEGYVPPGLAKNITPGLTAQVAPDDEADVNRSGLSATVEHLLPSLDDEQRAARVLFSLETPGGWPKPGQQVRLALQIPADRNYIRLPLSAVEFEGEEAFVFVQLAEDKAERKRVVLKDIGDTWVLVSEGLDVGERVAVSQVFSLKALSRFDEYAEE